MVGNPPAVLTLQGNAFEGAIGDRGVTVPLTEREGAAIDTLGRSMNWTPVLRSVPVCGGAGVVDMAFWGDLTLFPGGFVYNYGGWAATGSASPLGQVGVPPIPRRHPLPNPLVRVDGSPLTLGYTLQQVHQFDPTAKELFPPKTGHAGLMADSAGVEYFYLPVPGTEGTYNPSDRVSQITEGGGNC